MNPRPALSITKDARIILFNHLQMELRVFAVNLNQSATHNFNPDDPAATGKALDVIEKSIDRAKDLFAQLKAIADPTRPFTIHELSNPVPPPFSKPAPTPTPESNEPTN